MCLNGTPSGNLILSRHIIRPGATVVVHWQTDDAATCTVTGSNGDSWTGTSGTETSSALTDKTTFTLSCDGLDSDSATDFTDVETVIIVPFWKEV